jgi:hypothetical protein
MSPPAYSSSMAGPSEKKPKSFEESMKEFMREYAKILPSLPD